MDEPGRRGLTREGLLKRAGVVGVAAAVPGGVVAAQAAKPREREQLAFFTADEADAVEAFVDRLIPTDANGAGAAESRVARYIDRALAGDLRGLGSNYSANLAALDAYSQSRFAEAFAALRADQQDAVLTSLERDEAPGFAPSSAGFFNTVREHALQGMFGDPVHGGNAEFAGWDLLDFPGIKLNFLPKEQELDVSIRRVHKSTADYPLFGSKGGGHAHG
jgi:hypothetical protein